MRFIWRIVTFLGALLRALLVLVGAAALALAAILYFHDQPMPHALLTRVLDKLSAGDVCIDARSGRISLREGLVVRNLRLLSKRTTEPPWLMADEIRVEGRVRPDRSADEWVKTAIAHRFTLAALPSDVSHSAATVVPPANLAPIDFDLVDADFLGMRFKRVQGRVRQSNGETVAEDVRIAWPSSAWNETATGEVRINPSLGHIEGRVAGHTVPERIYPLFRLLHANDVENICRRFAFAASPVDVETVFLVAPEVPRVELRITLSATNCSYNGVPVRHASAIIAATGSNGIDRATIEPLVCERDDGTLRGGLVYDGLTSNLHVRARSDMPLAPLTQIIGILGGKAPTNIVFTTPPNLTIEGFVALEGSADTSSLTGTVLATNAVVNRVPVSRVEAAFGVHGSTYSLTAVKASLDSGQISGDFTLVSPPGTQAAYRTTLRLQDVNLETISLAFGLTNRPAGKINGHLELKSRLGATHDRNLDGDGDLRIDRALLSRIPVFAGFTDALARNVPGVEHLVDQSEARLPFTIANGILYSDGALVEGDIFSLSGKGTYSVPADKLDFQVRASIFRRHSVMGTITHIVTMPFAKLLLEFHVAGSAGHPTWEYRGIVERIFDSMGEGGKQDVLP